MKASDWNAKHPIGTKVRYWPVMGDDEFEDSVTRSEAWELGHGAAVVKIDGRSGGVALSHLHVLEPAVFKTTGPVTGPIYASTAAGVVRDLSRIPSPIVAYASAVERMTTVPEPPAVKAPEWFATLVGDAIEHGTYENVDDSLSVSEASVARALWIALRDRLRGPDPTHRHVQRGTEYRVTSTGGEVQTSRPIVESDTLTTYVDADGKVWHRLDSEFNDGRFVEIGGGDAG